MPRRSSSIIDCTPSIHQQILDWSHSTRPSPLLFLSTIAMQMCRGVRQSSTYDQSESRMAVPLRIQPALGCVRLSHCTRFTGLPACILTGRDVCI